MGVGLGCLALLLVTVVREENSELSYLRGWGFIILLISSSGYLTESLFPPELGWIPFSLLILCPAAFCLVSHTYFADKSRLSVMWSIIALYSCLPPIVITLVSDARSEGIAGLLAWHLPQIAEVSLIVKGLSIVFINWENDLIEERRSLRKSLLLMIGTVSLFVVTYDNLIHSPRWIPHSLVIFSIWLVTYKLMTLREVAEVKKPTEPLNEKTGSSDTAKPDWASEYNELYELNNAQAKLERLMSGGFYRTEKLTIKKLSTELNLSDYKLRKLVNTHLGYRNFNDYINQLRVNEAAKRLVEERESPILNISLDVGYRSLTSFNRAFKEYFDVTPTEYRQQRIEQLIAELA